jgi:hypothetical protein
MIYKGLLVLVLTLLTTQGNKEDSITIAICSFLFMLFMLLFSYFATPFIDPLNDMMDESGRFTTIIAAIAGMVSILQGPKSYAADIVGFLVLLSGVLNGIFMISIMCSGVDWFRNGMKNFFGLFTFHDSCKNMNDLSAEHVIATWQIPREIKHRIWQAFWNNIITKKCKDETSLRLMRLQRDAVDYGISYIEDHWAGLKNKKIQLDRQYVIDNLEGVDLYFNDPTGSCDGHLDSKSMFGKMYVVQYPFHCVWVDDEGVDEAFIQSPDSIRKFISLQNVPNIKLKVLKRKTLRALAASDQDINWPFSRVESRTVADGTDSYKDSDGNTKTKTHYSTISINMTYTNGKYKHKRKYKYKHKHKHKHKQYNTGLLLLLLLLWLWLWL